MKILIAGATGLVGNQLLNQLADHEVTAIGRRAVKGVAFNLIGPAEQWPALIAGQSFDVAISTLGTTIKQAGSQAAFRAIDQDAMFAVASAAKAAGARQFLLVSSVGANDAASNFYLKAKGEGEASVQALGFERLDIFRPGLLRGDRAGPPRVGESLATLVSPLTDLLTPVVFDKYRSIAAGDVATAMAALIGRDEPGVFIHHNREMLREAARIG